MQSYRIWIQGLAAFLAFFLTLEVLACYPKRTVLKRYREWTGFLKERVRRGSWYKKTEYLLCRCGATYHFGKWICPERYLILKIVASLAGVLSLSNLHIIAGLLSAGVLFFLPDWLLRGMNSSDNRRMLPEIKLIYHALEIRIRAGVYVVDALAECWNSVREKRLRQALLDLAGEIVMKGDLYTALESFQGKFDNRQIDALCITLLQSCESGQAVDLLCDIGEQLKDMESAAMQSKKAALDRSITLYQLGLLIAVLIVVVYACVSHLFTAAVKL